MFKILFIISLQAMPKPLAQRFTFLIKFNLNINFIIDVTNC